MTAAIYRHACVGCKLLISDDRGDWYVCAVADYHLQTGTSGRAIIRRYGDGRSDCECVLIREPRLLVLAAMLRGLVLTEDEVREMLKNALLSLKPERLHDFEPEDIHTVDEEFAKACGAPAPMRVVDTGRTSCKMQLGMPGLGSRSLTRAQELAQQAPQCSHCGTPLKVCSDQFDRFESSIVVEFCSRCESLGSVT